MRLFVCLFAILALLSFAPSTYAADAPLSYDTLVGRAQSLEQDGEHLAAFGCYLEAYRIRSGDGPAQAALVADVRDGRLPLRAPDSLLLSVSEIAGPLTVTPLLGGKIVAVSTRDEMTAENDPQNGWPFTRATWFYREAGDPAGELALYAGVHCQLSDDIPLGFRIGQLLYVIREALVEKTGYKPLTDGVPFNVWLCRHATDAGGEQWRNNIYFYEVGEQRSSIEWIREIAHEYSHMALPIVGGDYTDPEPWANGYYGERLLLRWLSRGAAGGPNAVEAAWGGTFGGYVNFDAKLIAPPLALFHRYGVSDDEMAKRDREGMEYLIGMLLALDDKAGPKATAALLWNLPQGGLVDPAQLLPGARMAFAKAAKASP